MVNIFTQEFMNLLKKILDMSIYIYIYQDHIVTSGSLLGPGWLNELGRWI
jgi:hypothetical protein